MLDGHQVVPSGLPADVFRGFPLGVQRVRGDDMPGQVQRLQQAQVTGGQQFTVTGRQISDLLQGRGYRSN